MPCVTSSSRPDNVVVASFCFGKYTTTRALWQWDYGIILTLDGIELPASYQVHFANSDSAAVAKIEIGDADGVEIPRAYLMTGLPVYAWVYLNTGDSDGETVYQITIPVQPRPKPEEFEPTPEEQSLIDQILAALNAAVEQTAADVDAADLSAQEAAAQADRAETAQEAAEAAQTAAETSERNAALSETAAGESETAARTYAANAARSESNAEGYAEDALGSANLADERSRDAADSAETAAEKAEEAGTAKEAILNMGATATTLPEGSTATVTKTTDQQGAVTLAFGIPRGDTGATGPQGDPGRGIASIVKTSTSGLVDTYTVTYSDGTTWAYQVTNGEKGDTGEGVAPGGTTGQMLVKATDTDYDTEWVDPPEGEVTQAEFDALQTYVEDMSPVVTAGPSAIVSVDDAAPLLAEKVEIAIEPVQDLHGYENPWPAGGGKNLLPLGDIDGIKAINTQGTWNGNQYNRNGITFTLLTDSGENIIGIKADGTSTANTSILVKGVSQFTLPAGTYTFTGVNEYTGGYDLNIRKQGESMDTVQRGSPVTLDYSEDTVISTAYLWVYGNKTLSNVYVYPMICDSSDPDSTVFAPYSNICPISGWTGANVEATGKNLWNGTLANNVNVVFETKTGQTYTISAKRKGTLDCYLYLNASVDGFQTNELVGRVLIGQRVVTLTFTAEAGKEYALWSNSSYTEADQIQIELGSTATAYAPYTGSTAPISWADEAGTVYGGTLEWMRDGTVRLTKTRVLYNLQSFTGVFGVTPNGYAVYRTMPRSRDATATSNLFRWSANSYTQMPIGTFGGGSGVADTWSFILPRSITSIAEANAWLQNNPTQICYRLLTPETITLTPTEALTLLRGANNLWADTGDTTLTYRQDVAILLRKLTSQVAALNTAVANT